MAPFVVGVGCCPGRTVHDHTKRQSRFKQKSSMETLISPIMRLASPNWKFVELYTMESVEETTLRSRGKIALGSVGTFFVQILGTGSYCQD